MIDLEALAVVKTLIAGLLHPAVLALLLFGVVFTLRVLRIREPV